MKHCVTGVRTFLSKNVGITSKIRPILGLYSRERTHVQSRRDSARPPLLVAHQERRPSTNSGWPTWNRRGASTFLAGGTMVVSASESARMKALVQEGSGSADVLHLREIAAPTITDDRVLVKVYAASVNAADYHIVHGARIVRVIGKLFRKLRPNSIRGVDVAGVVEAVGKNVTELRPGDEVFGMGTGTWAEYATGTERSLVPKPARLSFVEAGAIGVAALTALQGLRDHGHVQRGTRVL